MVGLCVADVLDYRQYCDALLTNTDEEHDDDIDDERLEMSLVRVAVERVESGRQQPAVCLSVCLSVRVAYRQLFHVRRRQRLIT